MSVLSLLLAVTTIVQDSVAPPPTPARTHRHRASTAIAPFTIIGPMMIQQAPIAPLTIEPLHLQSLTIQPMTMALSDLQVATTVLAMAEPQLRAIDAQAPLMVAQAPMTIAAQDLQLALTTIAPIAASGDESDQDQQDAADSLYNAGRRALNRNRYQDAIDAFGQVISRYPRSSRAPEALYWSAFARYRTGDTKNLQAAVAELDKLRQNYPDASVRDADNLAARIDGVLAQRGDADAAQRNQARADSARGRDTNRRPPGRDRAGDNTPGNCEGYGEDDPRIIALQSLLQMNSENALPILRDVLRRRDPCSVYLRRKAVFILSQKRTPETSSLLLEVVRSDPDREVREQAVFWLSQVPGEETVAALDSILRDPKTDQEILEKALFALSQHHSARAGVILRDFAMRREVNADLREKAIFWIGQTRSAENAQFLKDLYGKIDDNDLKEKIIFSLSQMGASDNYRWLMDIALNEREDIELRKKALFWANQGGSRVDIADLVRLYDSMKDREMRDQLIFLYSQRREDAALDKLFEIGKNDPDRELRKKAIFWIGQSHSPRAAKYLQDLINQ
ncbi:MAG TPA: HEAT repeat domain-containing protein [Gemmatimonadales bacterium]|nr:HEAT repeat domain-containing protein [Gemmatimonadales bacterium]